MLNDDGKYNALIEDVFVHMGLSGIDIEVRLTQDFGAFAVISKDCKRRSFNYSEEFFDEVLKRTKTVNALKSISYHEIGHHLFRHPLKSKYESHIHEKEADRFSGFQMRRIEASLEEAIIAMQLYGNVSETLTHPDKKTRIKEIKKGYINATNLYFPEDKSLKLLDSILFYNENMEALTAVFSNSNFYGFNIEGVDNDSNKILSTIDKPVYNLLGTVLVVEVNNDVLDASTGDKVGEFINKFNTHSTQLLRLESSSYIIENETIYTNNLSGLKMKVGSKIKVQ